MTVAHTLFIAPLHKIADALSEDLGAEKPEEAEVDKGGHEDADDEEDGGTLNPSGGEPGDEHRHASCEEEGEHVFQGREEGVADFLVEETMPDARPEDDDEDVGENHQGDGMRNQE